MNDSNILTHNLMAMTPSRGLAEGASLQALADMSSMNESNSLTHNLTAMTPARGPAEGASKRLPPPGTSGHVTPHPGGGGHHRRIASTQQVEPLDRASVARNEQIRRKYVLQHMWSVRDEVKEFEVHAEASAKKARANNFPVRCLVYPSGCLDA